MHWMAENQASAVIIGLLEQDFFAARENIDCICAEADRAGLRVVVTPSRWGNIVAGCPKVPSILCATEHDGWALQHDGKPWMGFMGPLASVHHPKTIETFETLIEDCLTSWPVSGLVWDEPKALHVVDHAPAAMDALDGDLDPERHLRAQAEFFGRMNRFAKQLRPCCVTSLFTYGHCEGALLDVLASTPGLDEFGCDGRPWASTDGGHDDTDGARVPTKFLIDAGPRFVACARKHGRGAFALIENHALCRDDHPAMERRLPEVIAQGWDHLVYYYYPRSCECPEEAMRILAEALRTARGSRPAWRQTQKPAQPPIDFLDHM
jgi:hypothetical protein